MRPPFPSRLRRAEPFLAAAPVTGSAIPAAVSVLIPARDAGLNKTFSLCCLDRHLAADWIYDESSAVIHRSLPCCSLFLLTSHIAPLPPVNCFSFLLHLPQSHCDFSHTHKSLISSSPHLHPPFHHFTSTTCFPLLSLLHCNLLPPLPPHLHFLYTSPYLVPLSLFLYPFFQYPS